MRVFVSRWCVEAPLTHLESVPAMPSLRRHLRALPAAKSSFNSWLFWSLAGDWGRLVCLVSWVFVFFSPTLLRWKETVSRFHSQKKLLKVEWPGHVILGCFKLARRELIKYQNCFRSFQLRMDKCLSCFWWGGKKNPTPKPKPFHLPKVFFSSLIYFSHLETTSFSHQRSQAHPSFWGESSYTFGSIHVVKINPDRHF